MNNRNHQNDPDDIPPYSRIFIVCSKDISEEDLTQTFEKYGEIENVYVPKDRSTGVSRGVAYIKYAKTSSAAAAIENLHSQTIDKSNKPIKVMIACKKNETRDDDPGTHDRLFIKISKTATSDEVSEVFSKYGTVESVHIQKDKNGDSRGLAYVQFSSFLEAAKAFEECDTKYKPVFAAPKTDLKRVRDDRDSYNDSSRPFYGSRETYNDFYSGGNNMMSRQGFNGNNMMPQQSFNVSNMMPMVQQNTAPLIKTPPSNYKSVLVTCTPVVPKRYLERLFNIIPGMIMFQCNEDQYNGLNKAMVDYEDERSAAHAVDRLNNYEFPSGELVTVKPDNPLSKAADDLTSIVSSFKSAVDNGTPDLMQLADAIAQASTLIKAATTGRLDSRPNEDKVPYMCSVDLPNLKPLAPSNSKIAKRCFVICKPQPPPNHILKDLFCRFGDLIDIHPVRNQTFVFVEYASTDAADLAIRTLHSATVCGSIKLKVLEAEDKKSAKRNDQMDLDDDMECDGKRMRLHDRN